MLTSLNKYLSSPALIAHVVMAGCSNEGKV